MLVALVLAQGAAGPVLPVVRSPATTRCPVESGEEVVVCAQRQDSFRLQPLPPRPDEPAPTRAEIDLGSAKLSAEAEQATLASGQQSRRLMFRLKLPLGGGKR
ncbi:hypothetical protein [Sphingomonas sp.]|jgi:antitoxin (DNA-binding transcriptional repressor) of toxin-antitoxin stability system|uniref:hypothetical protein n=1 Tax=Sphingomonas sp. TaxID=28214 RepID=UPI002D7EFAF8|nr:hypothetical protein [Sphingomonas sp.]HEU0044695.1 hypothetical protein [Sphingomonas sp.]